LRKDKKIILQQTIIPDYRLGLFVLIQKHYSDNFQVIAGDRDFGGTPVSTKAAWEYFRRVRNFYLFNDNFLWQRLIKKELLKTDVVILNANIRIISNVILLFLRKLTGRKTLLWGHVDGKGRIASFFRRLYFRSSDGFIAYTEAQKKILCKHHSNLKIWVAPNSCVSFVDCVPVDAELQELDSIIYVGRLVKTKKVDLLLKGFIYAKKESWLPKSVRLIFVGDGELRSSLEAFAREADTMDAVHFAGHISDVCKLREYYRTAICSVSPGYVGLSAIQSFSFGVPILIAKGENHSPEIEACEEGFNSRFFNSDDPVALAKGLSIFYKERAQWLENRPLISEWTRRHYSFETMRDAFIRAIDEMLA
jgi:glycosyltransferase involved in cell wall biosynthesis